MQLVIELVMQLVIQSSIQIAIQLVMQLAIKLFMQLSIQLAIQVAIQLAILLIKPLKPIFFDYIHLDLIITSVKQYIDEFTLRNELFKQLRYETILTEIK